MIEISVSALIPQENSEEFYNTPEFVNLVTDTHL